MAPQSQANEAARLEVLHEFAVLDTDPEQTFDDITRLAAYICHTPIAIITLVDAHRQWFKARVGLSLEETARDVSFCAHAIKQPGPMVVRDALDDERFRNNPLVLADPYIRFYAGSPLTTVEGFSLGTLCVIDRYPREITPEQMAALRVLSQQVMTQLELRRTIRFLTRSVNEAKKKVNELEGRLKNEG
ncbi:MAG TPA: GAF domain-containing protein [Pyrinomonadaceae bacterium]|jgi:GAF domain-containing protein|nr:GAF domain-containing protein [Pyrinomonadaceae bacterium]